MKLARSQRAAAVIAVLAITATGCGSSKSSSKGLGFAGTVRTPPLVVQDVTLPDVSAAAVKPFAMRAPNGGYLAVYFGYTHCADQCPLTLGNLSAAVERLPRSQQAKVAIAFATVDPMRDTPSVLRDYVGHWSQPIHALRESDTPKLDAAMRAFRVTAKPTNDMHGSIDHSASTAVVDDRGVVVLEWPFGISTTAVAHDLGLLLSGTNPAVQS